MKPEKADLIETDLIAGFQGLRGAGSEEMVAKGYKLLITRQICSWDLAQSVKNLPAQQETWVGSPDREDPLQEEMATHSSILARESHGQRSLAGYSPWGHKESDTTEQLALTHSLQDYLQ